MKWGWQNVHEPDSTERHTAGHLAQAQPTRLEDRENEKWQNKLTERTVDKNF